MPSSTATPKVTATLGKQAARIGKRRRKLGLTLAQLAAEADCSPAMVRNLEQGHVPERSKALPKVLEALKRLEQ